MPVKAGERLDPEATRARILAAASEVFAQRGIHAVGINEVAEVAGASKLTIYRNFGSKDGLVEAVLTDRTSRVRAWHERAVEQADTGRDRILAVFDLVATWYAEAGFRGCAMMNAATEDRGRDGAPRRLAQDHLAFYRDLFSRLLAEAGARDPETTARQLVVVLEGATIISAVDRNPGLGAEARVIVETLLDAA
ncbi:TetR/AcrR family transcriptional regulator [Kribbella antibiotica]|uniref:TetR/AcrR family transcriptional regulator n=1 Tax=Kribbella antibiotica TaxID=190195 RepID=A0A4R4Z4J6_9ACTN|nr:TetR/AcrR family transcriptional regulator [Kribbella antibiotica]TDD51859.1 TetR/AcrR family transcriptional regulator [Kribbella antibiotica]